MPLGKGLDNLLGEYFGDQGIELHTPATAKDIIELDIAKIHQNPFQTRKHFDTAKIQSLAASIDQQGLINPITVLKDQSGKYVLLAGERRLRAFQYLKKKSIPSIVKDVRKLTEEDRFLISANENLQRENLNPMELAKTFRIIMEKKGMNTQQLAKALGSSHMYVVNYLNLLGLSESVQDALEKGLIGEAHARQLGRLSLSEQPKILKKVISEKLSKRQLIVLIAQLKNKEVRGNKDTGLWRHDLPQKRFSELLSWAKSYPKSQVKARGDEKKGKVVITWGGFAD